MISLILQTSYLHGLKVEISVNGSVGQFLITWGIFQSCSILIFEVITGGISKLQVLNGFLDFLPCITLI
ncbi:hypothetical protein Gotur_011211 [Gossypium turneri]